MIRKEVPFIDIHTHHCVITSHLVGEPFGVASGTLWSAAIHPWKVAQSNLTLLETLLKENRIAAIGETGLDRIHKDTFELQLDYFEKHILLSEQYQKPLIIHNVKATADILNLHKKHRPSQTWIIHGFNGTETEVCQLTEKGICLSVGESIYYQNRKITQSIKSIPLEYLFLETDTSERSIQEIYGKASELLDMPLETLIEQIFANFVRLNLTSWKTGNNEPDFSSATMALINLDEAMC